MTIDNLVLRRIQAAQLQDAGIKAIIKVLEDGSYENYLVENEILYKEIDGAKMLVIPRVMQFEIIRSAHETGHFGVKKTEELIERDYFIPDLSSKIKVFIAACVPCILSDRKRGKQEGFFNPIPKQSVPFDTYHVDHVGPLPSTKKKYRYVFVVVDAFTKFCWLYPTKSLSSEEVITKLKLQQSIFGNPRRMISDRHGAFGSVAFKAYCEEEGIHHLMITTGVPRGNGQAERIIQTMIGCLKKMSLQDEIGWYKHVPRLQRALNSTYQRSIGMEPFKLMFGVKIRRPEDRELTKIIEDQFREVFQEEREVLRKEAKEAILKVQEENKKTYNLRRRKPEKYTIGDIVSIKRTQFGQLDKLNTRFLGPYKITKANPNNRYEVERIGDGEGSRTTTTSVDNMKPWKSFGSNELQDGRGE